MAAPVLLKNAADTWTNQAAPTKNYNTGTRLPVRAGGGALRYAWIFFTRPWPAGATIVSAKLRLYSGSTFAGACTVSVQRAAAKWSVNKVTWSGAGTGQPGVLTGTASVTKTGATAGTLWEFDVQPLIQAVSDGGVWYGFRVATNSTGNDWFHSAQAVKGAYRPVLEVTWSDAPDTPDGLSPGGGRSVSLQKPVFRSSFVDVSGDVTMASMQIQIDAANDFSGGTPIDFDSNEVPVDYPQIDSSASFVRTLTVGTTSTSTNITSSSGFVPSDTGATITGTGIPAGATMTYVNASSATLSAAATLTGSPVSTITKTWAGLADAATTWWRDRVKDGAGLWSPWSDPVQYRRDVKGTLAFVAPAASPSNFLYEPSPDITWTFTGKTQKAFQVIISLASDPSNWLWDSGKITSTATACTVPFGVINPTDTYRVTLRIWDTISRESTPGDPVFVEATRDFTIAYDNTVTAPASFGASSDAVLPVEHLTWTRASAPDTWVLQRSDDGGTTWSFIREEIGSSLSTGGTNYGVDDATAAQYTSYTWRILAVVGGRMSAGSPTVAGSVRRLAPFLMRTDNSDACCFLNPERSRQFNDVQELYDTLGGEAPVLVTQKLGRLTGSVAGVFTDQNLPGVTGAQMLARFLRLRRDSGAKMIVAIANQTFVVAAYNFQYEVLTSTTGITYKASFDWVENRA